MATAGPGCRPTTGVVQLPPALRESSGVAVSLRHPGVFWTHADAGSVLYAIDTEGRILSERPLDEELYDWEDVALAACGEGASCLYAADTGDNYEERASAAVHRFPEPDPAAAGPIATERFPIRLPEGPRDIEALFVLPGERIHLVTKGRNHPVTVYRYPPPLRPDTVTLERVQELSERARVFPRQLTGGAVSPDGALIALRSYEGLTFYRMVNDTLAQLADGIVNLRTLQEVQGEGVGLGPDGLVALTSEGGPGGAAASMNLLSCRVEE